MRKMQETEVIIARIGGKQNCILLKLSEYKGSKVLDIRRHFLNKSTGKLQQTKKGITLTQKHAEALVDLLLENEGIVKEWFDEASTTTDLVKKNVREQEQAKKEVQHGFRFYERDIHSEAVSSFFSVESNGAKERVSYNLKHPFYAIIQDTKSKILNNSGLAQTFEKDIEVILFLVDAILISYYRAKNLLGNGQTIDPKTFFESLELNWSATLKRYIKELKQMIL